MNKNELFEKINKCNKCDLKYGSEPFHFPIRNQRVMLITACPSIQAVHRPLTSIRFFRQVSVALNGDKGISIEAVKAINDLIYWTHLHKCCYSEVLKANNFSNLPNNCTDSFIKEEIEILKPEIIIIFGGAVADRLVKEELKSSGCKNNNDLKMKCFKFSKWNAKLFVTDFPKNGDEDRFNIIREELSKLKGFEYMRPESDKRWQEKFII